MRHAGNAAAQCAAIPDSDSCSIPAICDFAAASRSAQSGIADYVQNDMDVTAKRLSAAEGLILSYPRGSMSLSGA